jgi:2-methylcitrate dehydratase
MVTPLQFREERIKDPALPAVMDKIKVVPNQEFEALFPKFQPSRVTVTLADGRKLDQRVDVPKGDPRDPMTEDEIAVKFDALGRDVVGPERCARLREVIMNVEREKSLDRLISLMTVPTRPEARSGRQGQPSHRG